MFDYQCPIINVRGVTIFGNVRIISINQNKKSFDMKQQYLETFEITNPYFLNEVTPKPLKRGRYVSVRTEPTIGRNEHCTCGSGKKYKKCCG